MRTFALRTRPNAKSEAGFTIIELMVGALLAAIMVAIIYALYISYSRVVIRQDERVEVQQVARLALQSIKADMMLIGRNTRQDRGQEAVVFAAPWEIVFNADLGSDDQMCGPGAPVTNCTLKYSSDLSKTYTGSSDWDSKAETVRYYIWNPNADADFSFSPYDREIRRSINANPNQDPADTNDFVNERIAYGVRYDSGTMEYSNGNRVAPLFQYWGDFDLEPTTPDTLWGDSDNNGTLSDAELAALYTGTYTWAYNSQSGNVSNSNIKDGAIVIGRSGKNTEDTNGNGELDVGEDLNGNGSLDTNLLDHAIHRVELNITTVSQYVDETYTHPWDSNYHYREHHLRTSVDPRNLMKGPPERTCGDQPTAPNGVNATEDECGRRIYLTWNASSDDGSGENDVLWYEVLRKTSNSGGDYRYLAFVPATGYASYSYTDTDIRHDAGTLTYTYRVIAVDCADQSSAPADSGNVTPVPLYPTTPDQAFFVAYDSPCYSSGGVGVNQPGSITLQWRESMTGGSSDRTNVDQYWIYRSEVEVLSDTVPEPIAKVDLSDLDTCAPGSSTADYIAHKACKDSQFFDYVDEASNPMIVWRDEVESPGRDGVSVIPHDGHQFGIGGDLQRYLYKIRAYNADAAGSTIDCWSDYATVQPLCDDNYCDVQSNNRLGTDGAARSRFSPPQNLTVRDASVIDVTNVVHPRFILNWTPSQNEFCNLSPGEPEPSRYLIMRSKNFLGIDPGDFTSISVMLDERGGHSCELKFWDTDFYNNVFTFLGPAANVALNSYEFVDDSDYYAQPATYPDHRAFRLQGTDDLRPNFASEYLNPNDIDLEFDPVNSETVYEYMVVAADVATAGGNPAVGSPWGFGASCVEQAKFECSNETFGAIESASVEQCSLRSAAPPEEDDAIITWTFDPAATPGSTAQLALVARNEADPSSDWLIVDPVPTQSGTTWTAYHTYLANENDGCGAGGVNCVGQEPPTRWEYAVQVVKEDCTRYVALGAHLSAGFPDELDLCYYNKDVSCDPDAKLNCATGLMAFDFEMNLDRCPTDHITDLEYTWFRIVRWSKSPTNNPTYGSWPWCPGSYDGDPYTCSRPDVPAEKIYYIRADGTCPTPWVQTPTSPTPPYECFPGFIDRPGPNSYRFQEYVNPNLDYWYMIEVRMNHDPSSAALTRPPRCCPGHWYPSMDCPVPYNGYDTCNGGFPNNVITFEHIQCYPTHVVPAGQHPGLGDMETFPLPGPGGVWEIPIEDAATGFPYGIPWSNWNWTLIDFSFWGIHFYIGDHMFKYAAWTHTAGQGFIATDVNNFFGQFLNFLFDLGFEIGLDMCRNLCLPFNILCLDDVWPSCESDLRNIMNHNFVWSNFEAGTCGATSPGNQQTMIGDMLFHYAYRQHHEDRKLDAVIRGTYDPASTTFNYFLIEEDFDGNNTAEYRLSYIQDGVEKQYLYGAPYTENYNTNSYDDNWWVNLILVCTNQVAGSSYFGHTFIYYWTKPDTGDEAGPTNFDWQRSGGAQWFYSSEPKLAFSTIGKTAPDGSQLRTAANKTGKVGFWHDPRVRFETDNSYYDNIRITEYCGQCPPAGLIPFTKMDGNEMPDDLPPKTWVWSERPK